MGDPIRIDDHSFCSGPTGKPAIPYGSYDLSADTGWVNAGTDHDISASPPRSAAGGRPRAGPTIRRPPGC
jgi:Rhodopirellula transposase DDE domain